MIFFSLRRFRSLAFYWSLGVVSLNWFRVPFSRRGYLWLIIKFKWFISPSVFALGRWTTGKNYKKIYFALYYYGLSSSLKLPLSLRFILLIPRESRIFHFFMLWKNFKCNLFKPLDTLCKVNIIFTWFLF